MKVRTAGTGFGNRDPSAASLGRTLRTSSVCLDMGFVGEDQGSGTGEAEQRTVSYGARRVKKRLKRKRADSRAWNPPLVYCLAAGSFRR